MSPSDWSSDSHNDPEFDGEEDVVMQEAEEISTTYISKTDTETTWSIPATSVQGDITENPLKTMLNDLAALCFNGSAPVFIENVLHVIAGFVSCKPLAPADLELLLAAYMEHLQVSQDMIAARKLGLGITCKFPQHIFLWQNLSENVAYYYVHGRISDAELESILVYVLTYGDEWSFIYEQIHEKIAAHRVVKGQYEMMYCPGLVMEREMAAKAEREAHTQTAAREAKSYKKRMRTFPKFWHQSSELKEALPLGFKSIAEFFADGCDMSWIDTRIINHAEKARLQAGEMWKAELWARREYQTEMRPPTQPYFRGEEETRSWAGTNPPLKPSWDKPEVYLPKNDSHALAPSPYNSGTMRTPWMMRHECAQTPNNKGLAFVASCKSSDDLFEKENAAVKVKLPYTGKREPVDDDLLDEDIFMAGKFPSIREWWPTEDLHIYEEDIPVRVKLPPI